MFSRRFRFPLFLLVLAGLLIAHWGINRARAERVLAVSHSALGNRQKDEARMIPPDNDLGTYEALLTALSTRKASAGYPVNAAWDNAPQGRPLTGTRPIRMTLDAAWTIDQHTFPQDALTSLEHTTLWFGPLAHALFASFIALAFYRKGGPVLSIALAAATLFAPSLAGAFAPGILTEAPWALCFGLLGTVLLAGIENRPSAVASGVCLGLALWISPAIGFPALLCVTVAACLSGLPRSLVRVAAGAALIVISFGAIFETGGIRIAGSDFGKIHFLYGVTVVGLAELIFALNDFNSAPRWKWIRISGAFAALASLPVAQGLQSSPGWLQVPAENALLTGGVLEGSIGTFFAWCGASKSRLDVLWGLVPLVMTVLLAWPVWSRREDSASVNRFRGLWIATTALTLWAWFHPVHLLAALTMGVLCLAALIERKPTRLTQFGEYFLALLFILPGGMALRNQGDPDQPSLASSEATGLLERDLSLWLSRRAPKQESIVLAPPSLSASLAYHGGFKTILSPSAANQEGPVLAARLCGTAYADEARGLLQKRGVNYIVLPSWDSALDELASVKTGSVTNTFISNLHQWLAPRYLRALPYQAPLLNGTEAPTVSVFEVVEVQETALALSRLALFFGEMEMPKEALGVVEALGKNFDEDPSGLIARGVLYQLGRDTPEHKATLERILSMVEDPDIQLEWDIRVTRAILLAQEKKPELAKKELQQCMAEISENAVRTLSPVTAYRFAILARAFSIPFPNAKMKALVIQLAPEGLQDKLRAGG